MPDTFEFRPFQEAWYWGDWKKSPLIREPDRLASSIDIAVCKLPERTDGSAYQPLNLSLAPFTRGETACAIGYALMEDIPIQYVAGYPRIDKFAWELYVSIGEVTEVFPLNHLEPVVPTPGPCFEFQARIPGANSRKNERLADIRCAGCGDPRCRQWKLLRRETCPRLHEGACNETALSERPIARIASAGWQRRDRHHERPRSLSGRPDHAQNPMSSFSASRPGSGLAAIHPCRPSVATTLIGFPS
jgi:hypothetical protein